jgi:hypothetical protein
VKLACAAKSGSIALDAPVREGWTRAAGTATQVEYGQDLAFGEGKPVGHWGGRYIWQLAGSWEFRVAWRETCGEEPRIVESRLIAELRRATRTLPFANLKG